MRKLRADLSAEYVRSLFSYDESSGRLTWAVRRKRCTVGRIAGGLTTQGYRVVKISGVLYKVSRIIWLLKTGKWPTFFIDHINGIPSDNRWTNLREATDFINAQNRNRPNRNSTTGLMGVHKGGWHSDKNPFSSSIWSNGKSHFLGVFATAELAYKAYLDAKKKFHPGYVEEAS
jgi:hypothetical protein